MIHRIFTVYDCKAEAYLPPMCMQTKGAMVRAFIDTVSERGHQFAKHPEDYTLFELGSYDDGTAKFELLETPLAIGKAIEFLKEQASAQEPIGNEPFVLPSPPGGNSQSAI
jgi:hypothetical protein